MQNPQKITFRGGIKVGYVGSTWPNGILSISQSSIILGDRAWKKNYEFPRNFVHRIEVKNYVPFFVTGIKIHHSVTEYDERVFFWVFNFKKVVNALNEFAWLTN